MKYYFFILLAASVLVSCKNNSDKADASGTFEAIETIIAAEATGKLMAFEVSEGEQLKQGQLIGYVDSTQIYLTKMQLMQSRKAILSGRPEISIQIEALKQELKYAVDDQKRMENLVKGEVASQKQLDDANTKVAVLQSRIDALKSSLNTSSVNLTEQGGTVAVQLEQLNDQLRKCRIINPVNGTVLTKYAEPNEMTAPGKALYKIADLSTIMLRAYISGDQLSLIKLNQNVKVLTDDGNGGFNETSGVVSWISDKSEFTPKTIQTKNERANLVYAVKIKVKNDGTFKIGMYGEIKFL